MLLKINFIVSIFKDVILDISLISSLLPNEKDCSYFSELFSKK